MARTQARFGLAIPQIFIDNDSPDLSAIRTVCQRADQADLHSLWVQGQLLGKAPVVEPIVLLAYVAAFTERALLGTSVIISLDHNPVYLAKQIASLDQLSGGRLIVGIGTGSPNTIARVGGVPRDKPAARMLENMAMMRLLWKEEEAVFDGEFWQLDQVSMSPKPAQRPGPPIWPGGRHPNALQRAVDHGSGWMGSGAHPVEYFREDAKTIVELVEKAGRDRSSFTIAKRLYVAVDDDRERAAKRLRHHFEAYSRHGDRVETTCVYGTPDVVREGIQEVIDAGADMVLLNPVYDWVDQQEAILDIIAE